MATVTETQEHHFTLTGVPTLNVSSAAADVHIVPGADDAVHVTITKKATAASEDRAREALEQMEMEYEQAGDTITVRSKEKRFLDFNWGPFGARREMRIDITTPAQTNLRLKLNSGDGQVNGINGAWEIELNSGDLALREAHVSAPARLVVNSGDLVLHDIVFGAETLLGINSGDARLTAITCAAPTRFKVNSGNLRFDDVTFADAATLDINSGDADGAIAFTEHGSLTGQINSGDARLTLPSATDAFVSAAVLSGDLRVAGFPSEKTRHGAVATATQAAHLVRFRVLSGDVSITAR